MILVTGATGFVGKSVVARAAAVPGLAVREAVRTPAADVRSNSLVQGTDRVSVGEIDGATDWAEALEGVETVVHAAARVHVMRDTAADPFAEFRRVNVAGTLNLARRAADAGVRRLIFISSIKVNGEATQEGCPFTADDLPAPGDAYGISKHEAEQGLRSLMRERDMEVTIIRPVLVYGPGVKGNFLSMMRLLRTGIPIPLGAIRNQRSLVGLETLSDLILTCVTHPAAANETFLISDDDDLSTPSLLRRLARAMAVPARLLPVPPSWLHLAARAAGKGTAWNRLSSSLQVDVTKTRQLLGWKPAASVDEMLGKTADHFLGRGDNGPRARYTSQRH